MAEKAMMGRRGGAAWPRGVRAGRGEAQKVGWGGWTDQEDLLEDLVQGVEIFGKNVFEKILHEFFLIF